MRDLKLASALSWLVVRAQPVLLACTVCALVSLAAERPSAPNVRLGEAPTIKGQTYFVEKVEGGYTVGDPQRQAPMFVIDKARATFCFAEVCFTDAPFATLVREVRGGDTRELKPADPRWEGHFTLFSAAP